MFDLYRAEDLINQQEILITLIQNKMKDEYVIINKTAIQKRIEKLEKTNQIQQVDELKNVLSESTPLIPEIKKAFNAGGAYTLGSHKKFIQTHPNKQDYIANLKLDI